MDNEKDIEIIETNDSQLIPAARNTALNIEGMFDSPESIAHGLALFQQLRGSAAWNLLRQTIVKNLDAVEEKMWAFDPEPTENETKWLRRERYYLKQLIDTPETMIKELEGKASVTVEQNMDAYE